MLPKKPLEPAIAAAALTAQRPNRCPDSLPFLVAHRTWMQPSDLVAYVDVDDTLVRQTGTKRIPMSAVVEHVRQLHQAGVTLFCWSAGGADYSRQTARELGIETLFAGFLPKPHVLLDDQPPSEWPNCIVAVPSGLASATAHDHIEALARRGRANKA